MLSPSEEHSEHAHWKLAFVRLLVYEEGSFSQAEEAYHWQFLSQLVMLF